MLFLRIIGFLTAAGIAVLVLLFFVSRDRKYLRLALRLFTYAVFLLVLILLLFFLERLVVLL
ncbi:MAG: hypothetical protein OEW21_05560 [Betaproteobacteria bacterium]|nr:hypothetical protein [Betaproteobacteria bacterium]